MITPGISLVAGLPSPATSIFSTCFPHFNKRQVSVNKSVAGQSPAFDRAVALLTADFTQSKLVISFYYASFGSFSLLLAG